MPGQAPSPTHSHRTGRRARHHLAEGSPVGLCLPCGFSQNLESFQGTRRSPCTCHAASVPGAKGGVGQTRTICPGGLGALALHTGPLPSHPAAPLGSSKRPGHSSECAGLTAHLCTASLHADQRPWVSWAQGRGPAVSLSTKTACHLPGVHADELACKFSWPPLCVHLGLWGVPETHRPAGHVHSMEARPRLSTSSGSAHVSGASMVDWLPRQTRVECRGHLYEGRSVVPTP